MESLQECQLDLGWTSRTILEPREIEYSTTTSVYSVWTWEHWQADGVPRTRAEIPRALSIGGQSGTKPNPFWSQENQ